MPQLDVLAYGSEVLWLVFMFFFLYFVILRLGLPKYYKILRFRQDKLSIISNSVARLEQEVLFINKSTEGLVVQSLSSLRLLNDLFIRSIEVNIEDQFSSSKQNVISFVEFSEIDRFSIVKNIVLKGNKDTQMFVKREVLELIK